MSCHNDWLVKARAGLAEFDLQSVKQSGILPKEGQDFFPVVSYPPVIKYDQFKEEQMFQDFKRRPARPMIGYLHIPFCPSRCTFCHWITNTKSKDDEVATYINYVEKEIQLLKHQLQLEKIPVSSVLWGGGTPTYPKPAQLEKLLKIYTTHFDLSECSQFSVEAEPTTLLGPDGMERLRLMKDYGVNRISLGVQSFDEQILRTMGRVHSHLQSLEALENIRKAGFDNSYIDLIYGYPGQTLEHWIQTLLDASQLDIDGYQLFRLRIKQTGDRKGNIVNMLEKKPDMFHSADDIFLMKYLGKIISEENGFHEYQRRIFSKQVDTSSHYLRDWFLKLYDVVSVGVSAWSILRGNFSLNVGDKDLGRYYAYMNQGKLPINRGKQLSFDDIARRSFMLPLKNDYLDKRFYHDYVGADANDLFTDEISRMSQLGMLEQDDKKIYLTQKGNFFADEVTTQFFHPDYIVFDDIRQAASQKILQR